MPKPKTEKPNLKRVNIDAHIKASKAGNSNASPRGRGRPRKNPERKDVSSGSAGSTDSLFGQASGISPGGASPGETHGGSDPESFSAPEQSVIESVHDTTAEARGFIETPFAAIAALTGIPRLALYPAQLDAIAPSFKIVYDKRILPNLGENSDLVAFAVVMSGVVLEKVSVFKEARAKSVPQQPNSTAPVIVPGVPTVNAIP